jgi:ceramide glucosyltransferase
MLLESLLIILGVVMLLAVRLLHGRLIVPLQRRRNYRRRFHYPSITVIRPIKGLDAGAEENIQAALRHGYPGWVETLFVFDDDSEPALPLVEETIRRRRFEGLDTNARVIFSGAPPAGRTGKLNAMIAGLREAKGELIAFADSDIRPDKKALTRLVETLLGTPRAGAAFAPVVVAERPRTVGDAGYTLLINALYGPEAAASTHKNRGELPFIMGQFMVFTREAIDAIGGLESAEGQLVDDMYLGMRVKAAGLRNMVSPHPVPIVQYGVPLREFWSTYVRWLTFSRSGLPGWEFKASAYLRGVVFWLGLIAGVFSLTQGWWLAAALNGLANLGVVFSNNILHRAIGGAHLPLRHRWVTFGLLLLSPLVLASILLKRQVTWRGRSYQLNGKSQLATGDTLPADRISQRDRRRRAKAA